jgi:lipopolysaccharide export system protein LptA
MKILKNGTRHCLGFVLAAILLPPATDSLAERADRTKQTDIVFDIATLDQNKRTRILEGNVVLTKGTMRFAAERMVVKEDDAGYVTAEAFGGPNGQVAFRQKRDGTGELMEGTSDRAEFDEKADTLKLLSRARLKSGGDELTGEYIHYNSATEVMQVRSAIPAANGKAASVGSSGRPTITIQPRNPEEKSKQPPSAKPN